MSPQDRLQAAMERLEQLQVDVPGLWDRERGGVIVYSDARGGAAIANAETPTIAHLVVILHRTIDAQLAILRAAFNSSPVRLELAVDRMPHLVAAVALADAILGRD